MLAGLNRTLDEWLCDSFVELIEEMEVWKWDDATGDFWSRLAKALQQSNISVTWVEQLDSRLASVHTTGKLSWAAATRSIRECKMIGLAAHQPLKRRHAQSLLSPLFRDPRAPHVLQTYPERAAPLPRRGGERQHAVGSHSALALCLYLAAFNPYSCCCFAQCRHV